MRQFKISPYKRTMLFFWDGRGNCSLTHTSDTTHTKGPTVRGWYLWRGRLDGHRLGRPAGRGGLGLHLLLDSVVVGDPPIHLGLRLQEQQDQSSGLGGPASPSRHPPGLDSRPQPEPRGAVPPRYQLPRPLLCPHSSPRSPHSGRDRTQPTQMGFPHPAVHGTPELPNSSFSARTRLPCTPSPAAWRGAALKAG